MVTANNSKRSPTFVEAAERAGLKRYQIETLTGLVGLDALEKQTAMNHANQEAENRWARKHVWGEDVEPKPTSTEEGKMGHILGDVTYPTPIVVPPQAPQQNQILPALALAAATLIPTTGAAAGVIGYLLAQPKQQPAQVQPIKPQEYEEFNLGLGRLEDFIKQSDDKQKR